MKLPLTTQTPLRLQCSHVCSCACQFGSAIPTSWLSLAAGVLQSAGEPTGLQQLETQRQAVLDNGDVDSAMKHEMQMLATLLNSQFGQAHVDHQQDLVMLQVNPLMR